MGRWPPDVGIVRAARPCIGRKIEPLDAWILEAANRGLRAIDRAVIDDHHLDRDTLLIERAAHRPLDVSLHIIGGDDDRDVGGAFIRAPASCDRLLGNARHNVPTGETLK
jgi:hypothetical protein